jgi:hypothetical protein
MKLVVHIPSMLGAPHEVRGATYPGGGGAVGVTTFCADASGALKVTATATQNQRAMETSTPQPNGHAVSYPRL